MGTKSIFEKFPVTNSEYVELESKFEDLCKFAAWKLKNMNTNNNCTDELDDFIQEFRMSIIRAGSYYKRQLYIEDCLKIAGNYARDPFVKNILKELSVLWRNRTRHGARRQKFGDLQEEILEEIVRRVVPENKRPERNRLLFIDKRFPTYCKRIIWNAQRAVGRKISRERGLRTGLVSLSEMDHFSGDHFATNLTKMK